MLVALIRSLFGFIAAVLAAGLVQVLFVAAPDLAAMTADRAQALGLLILLAATQSAVFALPFVVLAFAFAAWAGIRSRLYFLAVAIAIAGGGFLAQYAGEGGQATILNRYAFAAYLCSGLAAGLVYTFLAAPKARDKAA